MEKNSPLKLLVFLPTVREGRMCERVSRFIQSQLKGQYEISVLDPKELDLPLLKVPMHFYPDRSQIPQVLLDCEAKMKAADAFLVVTASYNYSMPPALTNLLDHLDPSLFSCKPSAIVSYSIAPYGGLESAIQLRSMLSVLGSMTIPKLLTISEVQTALDENGNTTNQQVLRGIGLLIKQLTWYTNALKNHRDKEGVCDIPVY